MVDRCSNCGTKFVKYPIKNPDGTINYKNLLKMDLVSLLFLAAIIFLIFAYIHDTKQCNYVIEHPIEFCEQTKSCYIIESRLLIEPTTQNINNTFSILGDD